MTTPLESNLEQLLRASANQASVDPNARAVHSERYRARLRRREATKVSAVVVAIVGVIGAVPLAVSHSRPDTAGSGATSTAGSGATSTAAAPPAQTLTEVSDPGTASALLRSCVQANGVADASNWTARLAAALPATTEPVYMSDGAGGLVAKSEAKELFVVMGDEVGGAQRSSSCVLEKTTDGLFAPRDGATGELWLGADWLPGAVVPSSKFNAGGQTVEVGYYARSVRAVSTDNGLPVLARNGAFVVVTPDRPTVLVRKPGDKTLPPLPPPAKSYVIRGADDTGKITASVDAGYQPLHAHACWTTPAGKSLPVVASRGQGEDVAASAHCGVAAAR